MIPGMYATLGWLRFRSQLRMLVVPTLSCSATSRCRSVERGSVEGDDRLGVSGFQGIGFRAMRRVHGEYHESNLS
jgi:hypothetical protein